jgi:hypothetical protein
MVSAAARETTPKDASLLAELGARTFRYSSPNTRHEDKSAWGQVADDNGYAGVANTSQFSGMSRFATSVIILFQREQHLANPCFARNRKSAHLEK